MEATSELVAQMGVRAACGCSKHASCSARYSRLPMPRPWRRRRRRRRRDLERLKLVGLVGAKSLIFLVQSYCQS